MAIQRGYRWFFSSGNQFSSNVIIPFVSATTPVDGTSGTGAGLAGKGSVAVAVDTGAWYYNTGTKLSPTWTAFGSTAGAATPSSVTSSGKVVSTSPTAGVGYQTGAGGAVTQGTSRVTGVTLNTATGAITLVSAAGSTTPATFTVTSSAVAAADTVIVVQKSGTDLYTISVTRVAAGAFDITSNTKSGTTTEQPVFNFAVIKGAVA